MRSGKTRLAIVLACAMWAAPVHASEFADRIILWLQDQGFTYFEVQRTWLGRIKIEAKADGIEREIILNARTGEVLRDYWEVEDDDHVTDLFEPVAIPEGMGNSRHIEPVQTEEDEDSEGSDDAEDSKDESDDDVGDAEDEEDEKDEEDEEDDEDEEDEEDD